MSRRATANRGAHLRNICLRLLLIGLTSQVLTAYAQQQLRLGEEVQVISGPLNVRDAPGISGEIIGQLTQGQLAVIVDASPYWADGYWWWSVNASAGITGWIAEGDSSTAFIERTRSEAADLNLVDQDRATPPVPAPLPPNVAEPTSEDSEVAAEAEIRAETPAADTIVTQPPTLPVAELVVDQYAHLPEPIRVERELIDSQWGGFWVSVAHYGPGPGRGGFVFSWGTPEDDAEINPHYWCESAILSNGPPFFERIELPDKYASDFEDSILQIDDLQVSCTDTGGITFTSSALERTLAFLRPVYGHPQYQHELEIPGLNVADANTLLHGTIVWLVAGDAGAVEVGSGWSCEPSQPGALLLAQAQPGVTNCVQLNAQAGVTKVLLANHQTGSVTWEAVAEECLDPQ